MKYSLDWLKEFIEISLPPAGLCERLTMGGSKVESLIQQDGDWVFEVEVTPNRPDLLSHLGLARETAALLGREFRPPRWLKRQTRPFVGRGEALPVSIEDTEGCRRYIGLLIENVRVSDSTPEIAGRLNALGVRPVNNIVDITNLCMLELGQPLHAFDADKLSGGIRVRRAKAKETITTIDGISRELGPEQLVIADSKKPVAIAGVMGGKETEVSASTKRIFLESAWFDPRRIRKSARAAKISSDSSYRFERGADIDMIQTAAVRAARMMCLYAGGKILKGLTDEGSLRLHTRRVALRPRLAQEVLGMRIYPDQQKKILQRLGCKITGSSSHFKVEPPSWRADIRIPEDIYEELARLVGYDRCPPSLAPVLRKPVKPDWTPADDPAIERQNTVRRLLTEAGAQEISTYSLVHADDHAKANAEDGAIRLAEPLSVDQSVLRKTLLMGALKSLAYNIDRKTDDAFRFFEIGRVFVSAGSVPSNPYRLSVLAAGAPAPAWGAPAKPLGLLDVKGMLDFLFDRLRVQPVKQELGESFFGAPAIHYLLGGGSLGKAALVDPKILAAFGIPENVPVAYAECELEAITAYRPPEIRVGQLPKVQPVSRDLAIIIQDSALFQDVRLAIESAGKPLLKSVRLFDRYKGKQVPPGKLSLAFRLSFSDGDRTLTDEEVASVHTKIVDHLKEKFGATLR